VCECSGVQLCVVTARYTVARHCTWLCVNVQVCNCVSSRPGTQWLVTVLPHNSPADASPLIAVLCNTWLLSSDVGVGVVACHIVSNVVRNVEVRSTLYMNFSANNRLSFHLYTATTNLV